MCPFPSLLASRPRHVLSERPLLLASGFYKPFKELGPPESLTEQVQVQNPSA